MGRHSKLLHVYRHVLVHLFEAVHQTYGYPQSLTELGLPDYDRACWWRWRKGKRVCSESTARRLVSHALNQPVVGERLSDAVLEEAIEMMNALEPNVALTAENLVKQKAHDAGRLRMAAQLIRKYSQIGGLWQEVDALAQRQETLVAQYRAKGARAVCSVYQDAINEIYFRDPDMQEMFSQMPDDE